MKKYFILIVILFTLFVINCPNTGTLLPSPDPTNQPPADPTSSPTSTLTASPSQIPTPSPTPSPIPTSSPTPIPTPSPTPTPSPIMIENFDTHTVDAAPGNGWVTDCITTPDAANTGVIVKMYTGGQGLHLMLDIFGGSGEWGVGYTGYAYAKKSFHAPAAGTIKFSYYHVGYNGAGDDPSYNLDFWLQAPADIATDSNPLWSNNTAASAMPFIDVQVHTEAIPAAGDYTLTWRVKKNIAALYEDEVYIEDIIFTYQ